MDTYIENEVEEEENESENDPKKVSFQLSEESSEKETQLEDRPRTRSRGLPTQEKSEEGSEKLIREMRKLHDTWNPTLDDMVEIILVGGTDDTYESPRTFQEAWNHPEKDERKKWREAIRKEFRDMIYHRKVWRNVKKKDIPNDRRLIGCKWVFKKKGNGVYRARLCAIGYTQIAGIDHGYAFAPVIGETAFRLVLVIGLFNGWIMKIVDVKTAFLNGDLDKEIFMTVPEGMDIFMGKA